MTPRSVDAYFALDAEAMARAGAPASVCDALAAHWSGRLTDALQQIGDGRADGRWHGTPWAPLMDAEHTLLSVKLGRGLPPVDAPQLQRCRPAALVYHYALYHHYFWISQRRAWIALLTFFVLSLRAPRTGMRATALFNIFHMATLAGWKRIGYFLARRLFERVESGRARSTRFAANTVFALFPYTTLVRGRLNRVDDILRRCEPRLPRDPYYLSLYAAGALYAAAYSGDIVRAEILAAHFEAVHRGTGLMRYRAVSRLLPLVPLALRGYSELIVDDFDKITAEHDPSRSDVLINSQFYRSSALIALSLSQFDRAGGYIETAIRYRRQSGSFAAWDVVDARIRRLIREREPLRPSDHNLFGGALPVDPPSTLGGLLIEAIRSLPTAFSGVAAFEERMFALLSSHIKSPRAELRAEAAAINESSCQIRVGTRYAVFLGVPRERVVFVERVLSTVAPVITVLERTVRELLQLKDENERISREAAVARTTQMLAHDVRRPFKMMQMAIDAVRRARTPEQLRATLDAMLPEVEKSAAAVNGLLQDVMEIGSIAPVRSEPALPEALFVASLRETMSIHPDAGLSLRWQLGRDLFVAVDKKRVARVFCNILVNAIEAMRGRGQLWFTTGGDDPGWVELTIGNSGPEIPEEDQRHLFSAFYTKDKPSGTGLGLAIAERVVSAHGGRIWCTSTRGVGVEFHFTLPVAAGTAPSDAELAFARADLRATALHLGNRHGGAATAAAALPASAGARAEIALVDDSRAFLGGWRSALGERVQLHFFRSPEAFWKAVDADAALLDRLDAVITDYRFSASIETGATFAAQLRERRVALPVFVSSSGLLSTHDVGGAVDAIIDKSPIEWPALQALIDGARS